MAQPWMRHRAGRKDPPFISWLHPRLWKAIASILEFNGLYDWNKSSLPGLSENSQMDRQTGQNN